MSDGLYIVIEGIVGSGKSTQSELLTQFLQQQFPNKEIVHTFEPGGSEIANTIRKLVQATEFKEEISPWCDAYLYASSRAQTLNSVVKPAIEKGNIVISDRSFISSLTIQGFAQALGAENVLAINKPLFDIAFPDIVIYFYIDPEIGLSRIYDSKGDKFEKEALEFYEKIAFAYKEIKNYDIFWDKWITIDVGGRTPNEVHIEVQKKLVPFIESVSKESVPDHRQDTNQIKLNL